MVEAMEIVTQQPVVPTQTPLRWGQVLSHLDPEYGGISTAVPELAAALAAQRVSCAVEAFCAVGEHYLPPSLAQGDVQFWPLRRLDWLTDSTLRNGFDQALRPLEGLHIHGLWDATSWVTSRAARSHRKPYVLSAHGMLEPWALRHGRLKKTVVLCRR